MTTETKSWLDALFEGGRLKGALPNTKGCWSSTLDAHQRTGFRNSTSVYPIHQSSSSLKTFLVEHSGSSNGKIEEKSCTLKS